MRNKVLMGLGLMVFLSLSTAPATYAASGFPAKIADLERYDNDRLRAPLLTLGSINYGVIDYRNDTDYRRVKISQSGKLEVRVRTYRGSVRVDLYRNDELMDHSSSLLGKPVTLRTAVSATDKVTIKVTGTNGAQYRLFVK